MDMRYSIGIHTVGDILVQNGYVLGPRFIPDFELVYFPEATGTVYEMCTREYVLDRPCFVFIRPNETHSFRFDPEKNVRHLFVHFDYGAFEGADSPFSPLLTHGDFLPIGANHLAASVMRQILRVGNAQGPRWKERIEALVVAVLEELNAAAAGETEGNPQLMPVQITKAIAYMEEHLAEPITIEEIAKASGWSHEHFTRVFAAHAGVSPKRALLERRLRKAEALMMSGRWTVKQISFMVGFGDEHHFSKMYKNVRGFNASDYIARCKNPLFRHTAAEASDPETPYPLNRHIYVNS